jgi:uncharacterized protein with PIN domain
MRNLISPHIARVAYCQYGKVRGRSAQLDFGDCCAYTLAKDGGEALPLKGNDFRKPMGFVAQGFVMSG